MEEIIPEASQRLLQLPKPITPVLMFLKLWLLRVFEYLLMINSLQRYGISPVPFSFETKFFLKMQIGLGREDVQRR